MIEWLKSITWGEWFDFFFTLDELFIYTTILTLIIVGIHLVRGLLDKYNNK